MGLPHAALQVDDGDGVGTAVGGGGHRSMVALRMEKWNDCGMAESDVGDGGECRDLSVGFRSRLAEMLPPGIDCTLDYVARSWGSNSAVSDQRSSKSFDGGPMQWEHKLVPDPKPLDESVDFFEILFFADSSSGHIKGILEVLC